MKIIAIISRDLEKGSTKYRLVQYLEFLRKKRINIEFINRRTIDASTIKKVERADLVFNQKCLFKTSIAKKLIDSSQRTIFDFDDAIYTRPGNAYSFITKLRVTKRLHLWLKSSDTVTTPNEFLASYARQYSGSVKIVPMALDMETWNYYNKTPCHNITIGWAGAPVNIPLIEKLDPVLTSLLKKFSFIKLAIFSGLRPKLNCPFEYYPFRPGDEPDFIKKLDIGLLPLTDEEYSMGKSPIKAIQYLACGIPIVGNVIGATAEILNNKNSIAVTTEPEWYKALEMLINNHDLMLSMGRSGREHAKKNHNLKIIAENFFEILSGN